MDYKEKYKEALANMQELYNSMKYMSSTDALHITMSLEKAFPELKESEDEKIRKFLHNTFKALYLNKDKLGKWHGESVANILAWLEKQGKDKEINNFDVLPGLYKCVNRMFDGTPDGKLLFEVGNIYKCLSKHDRAEFEVSYGHSVYLEDPVVCKHFIPFEKQGEQKRIWSKEDEIGLSDALWAIKQARTIAKDENDMGNLWYAERWLKSLKPQNRWKPSAEQIDAIGMAIPFVTDDFSDNPTLSEILKDLQNQLKALQL